MVRSRGSFSLMIGRSALWLVPSLVLASLAWSQPLPLSVPADTWSPNAPPLAFARDADTLYVGGSSRLKYVGPDGPGVTMLDASTGGLLALDRAWGDSPGLGIPSRVAAAPGGGWLATGRDATGFYVARVAAGSPGDVTWFVRFDDEVLALAAVDTRLYVAGRFSVVGGVARPQLAALDVTSGALLSWVPDVSGVPGIFSLAANSDAAFVIGNSRVPRRLDAATGAATTLSIAPLALAYQLAIDGDTLFLVGARPSNPTLPPPPPEQTFSDIAGMDTSTGVIAPLAALRGTIFDVDVTSGHLFVTVRPGSDTAKRLHVVDRATGASQEITQGQDEIHDVAVEGGRVFVSIGDWSGNAFEVRSFASANTGQVLWRASASQGVSLSVSPGRVVAWGSRSSVGGRAVQTLYALDLRTGRPTAFAPDPAFLRRYDVLAMTMASGRLIVGVRGIAGERGGILVFEPDGQLLPWIPFPVATAGMEVRALAVDGDRLIIGGVFSTILGQARRHLAAVSLRTGELLPWAPEPDGPVSSLTVVANVLLVGGEFTSIAGTPRARGAAFAGAAGTLIPWDPMADGAVASLALTGTRLAVAGTFTTLQGQPAAGVGSFLLSSGAVAGLNIPPAVGAVTRLAGHGNQLVAGGQALAAVDATSSRLLSWNPLLEDRTWCCGPYVTALERYADLTVVGGTFTHVAGSPRRGLALFMNTGAAPPTQLRARVVGRAIDLAWAPPRDAAPQSYLLDVSLGSTTVGSFPVVAPSVAGVVGDGTYTVRVRAVVDGVTGLSSTPMTFTVPPAAAVPPSPSALSAAVIASTVQLTWTAGQSGGGLGNVESYVIEVGSQPGLANLAAIDTATLDTEFSANAPAGTYFVRVRAKNAFGQSSATNEQTLIVP